MTHEPSKVLQKYLVQEGYFSLPYGDVWPLWNVHLPEATDEADDAAAIYDDAPQLDARELRTHNVLQHMGISLRLRSSDYSTGWMKMFNVMTVLSQVVRENIVIDSSTYTIQTVTNRSGVVALGLESGTKRRHLFGMNLVVALTEN